MLNSNNHIAEQRPTSQDIEPGAVPEDDLIIALSQEIDAIAAEIEQQKLKRGHLLQWRQMLLKEQQPTSC